MEPVIQNGSTAIPTANVMELCEGGDLQKRVHNLEVCVLGLEHSLTERDKRYEILAAGFVASTAEITKRVEYWEAATNRCCQSSLTAECRLNSLEERINEAEANIRAFYDANRDVSLRLYHYEQTNKKGSSCPKKKVKSKPSKKRR